MVGDRTKSSYKNNTSAKQSEQYICFLLARDGYVCNPKRDDGCGKSISDIITESRVREELTGKPRDKRVIVIDHEDNDPTHVHNYDDDGNIIEYCANLQLLCWSCNLKKRKSTKRTTNGVELTEAQKHKRKNEPAFINMIIDELEKRDDVCVRGILAKGSKKYGSQVSLGRYLETEFFDPTENPDGRFQLFDKECSFPNCNGEHLCFVGHIPHVETDEDRRIEEDTKRDAYVRGGYFFDDNKDFT